MADVTGKRQRQSGFSLIELLIVVAVIAILGAIALPNYREHVVRTRRAAAAACLVEVAQAMERRYTSAMSYAGAAPQCAQQAELAGNYGNVDVSDLTARTYTLSIAPAGTQAASDTKCGTMSVTQAGVKTVTGSASNASECF